MTTRIRKYQTEKTKEKIRTTQLVNRLQQYVFGENDHLGKVPDLSQGQIKAIQILLDKSLPSMSSVDQKVEQVEPRTEEQMMEELREMIARNPALKEVLKTQ